MKLDKAMRALERDVRKARRQLADDPSLATNVWFVEDVVALSRRFTDNVERALDEDSLR